MEYSEANLPVELKHGETLTLGDGTTVRFESNGEAKDIFLAEDFTPTVKLFPANEHTFTTASGTYRMEARFEDALLVEKTN